MSSFNDRKFKEIEFCIDNEISQAQYTFMYILYRINFAKKINNVNELEEIIRIHKKYTQFLKTHKLEEIKIEYLIENKFINKVGDSKRLKDYKLTEKFLEQFMEATLMINELWDVYPGFYCADGKTFPLKAGDKQQIGMSYIKKIENIKNEHNEVILDIRYGRLMNLIRYKIENFVLGEMWIDIRKERLHHIKNVKSKNNSYFNRDV